MREVRLKEQRKAALIGEYAAQVMLDYPSQAVKDGSNPQIAADLAKFIRGASPRFVYTHNLADKHDTHIIGTLTASAQPAQAALVRAIRQTGVPLIVVTMRMSSDLLAFPEVTTCLCTYSLLEPSMKALAQALWGESELAGRLPVSIPGLYPAGHRRGFGS